MDTSYFYWQRKADGLTATTFGRSHFSFKVSELDHLCVHIIGSHHNHLHTKNKIELWENNNINRIFCIWHLYISILQGSRMAETSNLLGCEMYLMEMWNIPFSMDKYQKKVNNT